MKYKSDNELLEMMRQDDMSSFNELYGRYWEVIYDIAYKKLNDKEEAKDIVHDLFLTIWTKREKITIHTSFLSYLAISLKNRIIDNARKEVIRRKKINEDIKVEEINNTTMDQLLVKELRGTISLEIQNMPKKMQEIFRLSREEELSVNEIAQKLSLSNQTVKNQISNALRKLRQKIG
jgi:RNA polymerase sigma-70 factor (ECF subfamily)